MSAGESPSGAGVVAAGIGNLHVAEMKAPRPDRVAGAGRAGDEDARAEWPGAVENLTTCV